MTDRRPLRVGLIGASPDPARSWGTRAHIPSIAHLPDYELVAVCTSEPSTAQETASHFGVPNAFSDAKKMAEHPDVDLVVVSVNATTHKHLVEGAIAARKNVFCEWPLGGTAAVARELAAETARAGISSIIGLQSYGHETLRYVRSLIEAGFVGRVLSTNWHCFQENYGPFEYERYSYSADITNNANLLRIATGHTLAAADCCLGRFRTLSAIMAARHDTVSIRETGEIRPKTSPDQIMITGVLDDGVLASIHMMGGATRTAGTRIEINGTEGDLLLTSTGAANVNRAEFTLHGGRGGTMDAMTVPPEFHLQPSGLADGPPLAVAHLYDDFANTARDGRRPPPDFSHAVYIHEVLDAIERSSAEGTRQILG